MFPESRRPADALSDTTVLERRQVLKMLALPCAACAFDAAIGGPILAMPSAAEQDRRFIVEARFYEKLPYRKVKCKLCPRECVVDDRERGYCGVREDRGGTYYTLVHSRVVAAHVDPIEKKPLFHVLPGTTAFSIATAGCNVNCKMCQNWQISQVRPEQVQATYLPPAQVAALSRQRACPVIAYTYSEPIVFSEYVIDTAAAGREMGIKSVVVTGGYVQAEPLRRICAAVDAIKVDLKGFSEKFYREVVNGELKPVLDTMASIRKQGVWLEIVCLVVPTLNDRDGELTSLARWVKTELGPDVPLHFSRFHPDYLLNNLPPTPIATLEKAKAIADAEGLHYVYIGNVPGHAAENTYCPKCRQTVIRRSGFILLESALDKGRCRTCQSPIPGVWA